MKRIILLFISFSLILVSCSSGDDNSPLPEDEGNVFEGSIELKSPTEITEFGANNYRKINGSLTISDIINQENITNLNALSSLLTISGKLSIIDNPHLENIEGLSNLSSVYSIEISNNESLPNIASLNKITTISGDLIIANNESLLNLNGLNNIVSIRSLDINNLLVNFTGLENLQKVTEGFLLKYNPSIISFNNLNNLIDVGYSFITSNINLTDYCVLENLQNEPQPFWTTNNAYNPSYQNILDGFCSL